MTHASEIMNTHRGGYFERLRTDHDTKIFSSDITGEEDINHMVIKESIPFCLEGLSLVDTVDTPFYVFYATLVGYDAFPKQDYPNYCDLIVERGVKASLLKVTFTMNKGAGNQRTEVLDSIIAQKQCPVHALTLTKVHFMPKHGGIGRSFIALGSDPKAYACPCGTYTGAVDSDTDTQRF